MEVLGSISRGGAGRFCQLVSSARAGGGSRGVSISSKQQSGTKYRLIPDDFYQFNKFHADKIPQMASYRNRMLQLY